MKRRLDQLLLSLGFCPSRTKSKQLINQGSVEVYHHGGWQVVVDPSFVFSDDE
ncbi:MAG: hypothetical protein KDD22_00545, partial [Bdellovibrionales bacterium]|nr:hypothetical protein [Bdellovibrionales bacterium]